MKKWLKITLCIVLALVLIVAGYVAYVLIDYHRIGDNVVLPISDQQNGTAAPGKDYHLVSYNIGFGAYEPDYGFFMDGGTQAWAWSKERLEANVGNIAAFLAEQKADFCLLQEVDIDSTRSYHVDERVPIQTTLGSGYDCVFAQNYDSPFLFYPITQPHGASRSGLMTFSLCDITRSVRRELPVEQSLMKLVDLDRCYSVSRIPVSNGHELVLYNIHLSAYTSDGTIANEQLALLIGDMQAEYEKGNYAVCGGDFNKDLLGDSSVYFGAADQAYTWAQPLPEGLLDGTDLQLEAPLDKDDPVPSCRNADGPYHDGQYVLTVDGFLVSKNVQVTACAVVDIGFAYSDHNPVTMTFSLKG